MPSARPPGRDARLPPRTWRIVHLDIDAFLASVEQALHPELRGKPVIVGGMPHTRNLVMSCSYEARERGVRPGMLAAEAARRCPHAIFRHGDSQGANEKREEVVRLLLAYTPLVEVASIEDFFVDLGGTTRLLGDAFAAAESMRRAIRERACLPVTAGVSTNKTLARLAGKLAKPGGIAEILPGHERAFLRPLPVRALPGVGRSIGAKLQEFSIRTVGELALVPRELLFASFGRAGLGLYERARGIDPEPVEPTHALDPEGLLRQRAPLSIRRDGTFEPEEGRREQIRAMLAYLVERASERLRAHGVLAGSMEVHLEYVDTRPAAERRAEPAPFESWLARRRALAEATDATAALARHAQTLLAELPRRRALVKRVGLTLLALRPSPGWQGHLFSDPAADRDPCARAGGSRADRERRLDRALDRLRARMGFGRILCGASLPLAATHPLERDGFRLRTPSLNQ